MWAPQLEQSEALHVELEYFADCVMNNKTPFNDGHAGLRVVRMLEAAEESIQEKGQLVRL
jgi:predicted dehydrogenase